ncbi:hypothetical protein FRACYDRAFT_234761 [Fragilariopsis cylindrus CCMP1102]|uniref:Uncharacterized protein n=1 Tax=Fragilariopsis cylindrus CCMP1102 TaxID=635003 RepID=A0A1E7FSQ3_9STRA|nr:hypothetical protein FRACYDRAFT_234761 [Fragilariopsis cylindrus CCMP1102]|eukprot:OEU21134.1 hypothetical protein FRACYDRAFT_234761 [Fragilariopsis cylindrus CCMP1102]
MKSSLLPILQQAFPTESVVSYETKTKIVQANAEGHLVTVLFDSGDDNDNGDNNNNNNGRCDNTAVENDKSCFVKTVDANYYYEKKGKNSWPDFRRTIMYLRTEVRFYQEILPDLLSALTLSSSSSSLSSNVNIFSTPEIYASNYNLDGLLTEEERATDDPMQGPVDVDWNTTTTTSTNFITTAAVDATAVSAANSSKGGYIVMETIPELQYIQDSPITIQQAKDALDGIAAFHASAWENQELLIKAQTRLSRGSYHLKTRNPKEVTGLVDAWIQFTTAFDINIDDNNNDNYATLSHGDCKAMNFFLPISNDENKDNNRGVILIDFASTGVGLGMSDVAMLIHHAIRPEHLDDGGEMMLVDHYINKLNDLLLLKQQQQQQQNQEEETHDVNDTTMNTTTRPIKQSLCYYPKEIALWHYKLAVADYFRFFLGRFWKSATPESFEKRKYSKNTAFINRDRDAAFAFIKRVEKYMTEIEQVKQNKDNFLSS